MGVCEKQISSVFADRWRKQLVGEVGTDPEGWTVCWLSLSVCFFFHREGSRLAVKTCRERKEEEKMIQEEEQRKSLADVLSWKLEKKITWKYDMRMFFFWIIYHSASLRNHSDSTLQENHARVFWVLWWWHRGTKTQVPMMMMPHFNVH